MTIIEKKKNELKKGMDGFVDGNNSCYRAFCYMLIYIKETVKPAMALESL